MVECGNHFRLAPANWRQAPRRHILFHRRPRIARTWGLADDTDVADAEGIVARVATRPLMSKGLEAIVAQAMEYSKPRLSAKTAQDKYESGRDVGEIINDGSSQ